MFKAIAPKLLVVSHVNQLHADGYVVSCLQESAAKHSAHSEFFAYSQRIYLGAFVVKDCAARTDSKVRQLGQIVDDGFRDSIRHVSDKCPTYRAPDRPRPSRRRRAVC